MYSNFIIMYRLASGSTNPTRKKINFGKCQATRVPPKTHQTMCVWAWPFALGHIIAGTE